MKRYKRKIGEKEITMDLFTSEEVRKKKIVITNVTQVLGICFNSKEEVMVVSSNPNKWFLPGGKPEKGENYEQTLKRELYEEACIKISAFSPIAFIRVRFPENPNLTEGEEFFQVRYACKISEIEEMRVDPATNILFERKFISPEKFTEYIKWNDAKDLIDLSLNFLNSA